MYIRRKSVAAISVAAIFGLGISGCGGDDNNEGGGQSSQSSSQASQSSQSSAASQSSQSSTSSSTSSAGSSQSSSSQQSSTPRAALTELRRVTALDGLSWRFVQDDALTDDAALAANGTSWTAVTLPHTWNAKDAASIEQTTPSSVSYKRGKGWYRLEFDNPANGATQWLQFDGASIVADVWLNGQKLGQHRGAFTAFRFDVTDKLKAGKNVLLVKADNTKPTAGTDVTAIIPLGGDFNMSGGLYRGVSVVATPSAAHFSLDDFGGSGIYARTSAIANDNAIVNVRARLKNDAKANDTLTALVTLADAAGNIVVQSGTSLAVKAGEEGEAVQDLTVNNAHLWAGLADPYLYKLVVELKDSSGNVVDRVIQDFGIRQMAFDPNRGFLLNGKVVPLHGVNLHQDYLNKAWAISKADTDESLALIKEIGANTLRLAHYPHSQYTLQQTDRMGLIIWAELPFVNQTALPCAGTTNAALTANAKDQLKELIRQQYNHSSIAMWSIGNETTQGCGAPNNANALLKELQTVAKAEDATRVTTLASNGYYDNTGSISDIWALNSYPLWYGGTPASLGTTLDDQHTKRPNQPIGVSEYGAGAAISHQSDNLDGAEGFIASGDSSGKTRIVYQPEGYANLVHEQDYALLTSLSYVWGTYVWNMFDFGSDIRHEGDVGGTNTKGLMTFDRKVKKDPFYFYKANWSKDPVTYITGRRYVDRNIPAAPVRVYSNADAVTLKVNGVVIKTMAAVDCPQKTCDFGTVQLAAGDNIVAAEGSHAGKIVSDSVTWKLDSDHATNRYIAAGQVATGFLSEAGGVLGVEKRFASDAYFEGGVRKKLPNTYLFGPLTNVGATGVPSEGRVWDTYREEVTGGDAATSTPGSKFSYTFKLTPGKTYLVTLGFMEQGKNGVGMRIFDIYATTGGVTTKAVASLDVFAKTRALGAAYAEKFPVTVGADGTLKLEFVGTTSKAMVSNIMVVQQ
ncbi:MAG: glycoside hydrolase family 2 TIM barrel-domain containing protein [Rhodocyclaceae bacterium]